HIALLPPRRRQTGIGYRPHKTCAGVHRDIDERDPRTLCRERADDGCTDARATTGHEHIATVQARVARTLISGFSHAGSIPGSLSRPPTIRGAMIEHRSIDRLSARATCLAATCGR